MSSSNNPDIIFSLGLFVNMLSIIVERSSTNLVGLVITGKQEEANRLFTNDAVVSCVCSFKKVNVIVSSKYIFSFRFAGQI